jgi:hypothetical protein
VDATPMTTTCPTTRAAQGGNGEERPVPKALFGTHTLPSWGAVLGKFPARAYVNVSLGRGLNPCGGENTRSGGGKKSAPGMKEPR